MLVVRNGEISFGQTWLGTVAICVFTGLCHISDIKYVFNHPWQTWRERSRIRTILVIPKLHFSYDELALILICLLHVSHKLDTCQPISCQISATCQPLASRQSATSQLHVSHISAICQPYVSNI